MTQNIAKGMTVSFMYEHNGDLDIIYGRVIRKTPSVLVIEDVINDAGDTRTIVVRRSEVVEMLEVA